MNTYSDAQQHKEDTWQADWVKLPQQAREKQFSAQQVSAHQVHQVPDNIAECVKFFAPEQLRLELPLEAVGGNVDFLAHVSQYEFTFKNILDCIYPSQQK